MSLDSATDLLEHQLLELYGTELQALAAMRVVSSNAHALGFRNLLGSHQLEVANQVTRLESCLSLLAVPIRTGLCRGIKGLLEEMLVDALEEGHELVRDASLAANSLRLAQFKIAMYSNAQMLAETLDQTLVLRKLLKSLSEERMFDAALWTMMLDDLTPSAVGLERVESPEPHLVLLTGGLLSPQHDPTSIPRRSIN